MTSNQIRHLTKSAVVAAIYVVLTLGIAPISYGPLQFRVAEVLNLLAFFNPIYIIGVTLGCFISNLNSPFGLYDVIFGTLHTFLSLVLIWKTKHLLTASLWPALLSIIIAFELNLVLAVPLLETWFYVALSEVLICTVIGLPLFYLLKQTGFLRKYIMADEFDKWPPAKLPA